MKNQAVIVGNDHYGNGDGTPGHGVNDLPGAIHTADLAAAELTKRGILCNVLHDAGKSDIGNAITNAFDGAASLGSRIIYLWLTMHGTQQQIQLPDGYIETIPCIVPVDAFPQDGSFHGENLIAPWQWAAKLKQRPAGVRVTVILDVCESGGIDPNTPIPVTEGWAHQIPVKVQYVQGPPDSVVTSLNPFGGAAGDVAATPRFPIHGPHFCWPAAAITGLVQFCPCANNELSVEGILDGLKYVALYGWEFISLLRDPRAYITKTWTNTNWFRSTRTSTMNNWPLATPVVYGPSPDMAQRFLL